MTSLGDLSVTLQELGRPAEVEAMSDEAVAGLREVGDDSSLAHLLCYRGSFAIDRARLEGTDATAKEIEASLGALSSQGTK